MRSLSDGSLATEQTFTIRSSSTKNICRYDLVRRAEPMIVRLVPVRFDINVFGKTIDEAHAIALSEANSRGRSSLVPNNFVWRIASLFGRITSTKTTVFTLREDRQIATPGAIQNKRVDFETSWVFAATGQQPEQISVLCRGGCAAGTTEKSSNVWIQWKGNLVSGSECEDAADFKATYNRDVSGWQITDKASYITYTTYLQASAYDDLLRYANGAVSADALQVKIDIITNSAVRQVRFAEFRIVPEATTLDNGQIQMQLANLAQFPTFRLLIDSDYLRLKVGVGKPVINSVADIEFEQGRYGIVKASVSNVGDTGSFHAFLTSCTSGFSPDSSSEFNGMMTAATTRGIELRVLGSTTSLEAQVSGSCTLVLEEQKFGATAKKQFRITMSTIKDCVPNDKSCGVDTSGAQVLLRCNSAGTGYTEVLDTCAADEYCSPSSDSCAKKGTTPPPKKKCAAISSIAGQTIIPNLSFSCIGFSGSFKIVLAFIMGLAAFAAVGTIIPKIEDSKVKTSVFAGSILAALLVGYLIYSYIIFGIVVVVLLFVFRGFIGSMLSIGRKKGE